MSVKVSMIPDWDGRIVNQLNSGLFEMSTDIHRRAVMLAPRDQGDLAGSGRVNRILNGYSITFGSTKVPYARRRHFENKKNPQTLGYLAKAGDSVVRGNTAKYFRGKI